VFVLQPLELRGESPCAARALGLLKCGAISGVKVMTPFAEFPQQATLAQ
jgi:hypothetical protein